jgi:hypothetical protein
MEEYECATQREVATTGYSKIEDFVALCCGVVGVLLAPACLWCSG